MARTQKNFSVLGDSISTFQGYSPWGAAHYSPDLGAATGVHTVEDTWWMQVIRALQGRLLSNLSISGNTISTAGTMGGFPPRRIAQLTVDGVTPDHILLYAGLNDANFYVPPEGFLREYQQLLSRLRQTYPHAQISCGTLILGAVPGTQGSLSCLVQRLAPYNQAIRSAVAQADCQLVDLAAMHSIPMELAWHSWPGSGSKEWKLPHRTETFFNFVLFFPLFFALTLSLCYNVICTVNSF